MLCSTHLLSAFDTVSNLPGSHLSKIQYEFEGRNLSFSSPIALEIALSISSFFSYLFGSP